MLIILTNVFACQLNSIEVTLLLLLSQLEPGYPIFGFLFEPYRQDERQQRHLRVCFL